jgi:hypothetical protein
MDPPDEVFRKFDPLAGPFLHEEQSPPIIPYLRDIPFPAMKGDFRPLNDLSGFFQRKPVSLDPSGKVTGSQACLIPQG